MSFASTYHTVAWSGNVELQADFLEVEGFVAEVFQQGHLWIVEETLVNFQ